MAKVSKKSRPARATAKTSGYGVSSTEFLLAVMFSVCLVLLLALVGGR